jgi:SAM-dependent methyltransferase
VTSPEVLERIRGLFNEPRRDIANVLQQLFSHERAVEHNVVDRAIGARAAEDLETAGLVRRSAEGVVSLVRVTSFRSSLIASDRLGFRRHRDFVVCPSAASALLADAIRPIERGRLLDLGCGPGTQALWLAGDGVEVVGVDINPRALGFARFNRELNARPGVSFALGDFLTAPADPQLDEAFDLVVANPPFVLSPMSALLYRDRPLPGNDTTRVALERSVRALAPGGRAYVLGNWFDDGDGPWDRIPRTWVRPSACAVAVTQVASVTPEAYATQWSRDLPEPQRLAAVADWTAELAAEGARRIHIGLVALTKRPAAARSSTSGGRPWSW